uniref:Cullin domain-containing protein n=1 Tax=Angiostrongylus cantonensis TaxID=6313 RepID=A0A0K0DH56_ANGCA
MGHRGFGERSRVTEKKTATEEDKYSCTQDVPARSCFEDMVLLNGTRELTEARRCRDEFRDDVSRRMGDLLLRGMTMLDAYCEVCNACTRVLSFFVVI